MTDSFHDVKMGFFDRREPSSELARISALVPRPLIVIVIALNHGSLENRLPQTNYSGNSPTIHQNQIGGMSSVAASTTPTTSQSQGAHKSLQFNQI